MAGIELSKHCATACETTFPHPVLTDDADHQFHHCPGHWVSIIEL